jgi:chromosome partitioning protein
LTITAFISNKGGTGKTTACVNVAACLAKTGKKVLVVDMDPIASTTSYLGIKPEDVGEYSMQAVVGGVKEMKDVIFEIEDMRIHIAPSHRGTLFTKIKKDFLAKEIKDISNDYDFIMIDTPPGFDEISRNAISVSDAPVAALNESIFAMENLPLLKETVNKEEKTIKCAIISTINRRSGVSRDVIKTVSKEFERTFIVPFDKRIPQSQVLGKPLAYLGKRSKALKSYMSVAAFIAGGV